MAESQKTLCGAEYFAKSILEFEKQSEIRKHSLFVIGDYRHFSGSVLGKISAKLFNVRHIDQDGVPDEMPESVAWIKWSPWSKYRIADELRAQLPDNIKIVNDTHFNCAKDVVQAAFEATFPYKLKVDPLTFTGKAVQKSKLNAAHDGKVVDLPLPSVESDTLVYERLIHNEHNGFVCDIRIPIILGDIPFVYLKFRSVENRFSNDNSWAKIVSRYDVLTKQEISRCLAFAREIGLQYGEIDGLRDVESGQLFLVDANNTPYGPPNTISADEADVAKRLIGGVVVERFFDSSNGQPG